MAFRLLYLIAIGVFGWLVLLGRLVAGQRRAGECGDERGRGCGAGEQGPLAVGSGPPLVEPVQQPGDRLDVALVPDRGMNMLEEAGAERQRIDGLPADWVDACPGEPLTRRGGQGRGDLPGRRARTTGTPLRNGLITMSTEMTTGLRDPA